MKVNYEHTLKMMMDSDNDLSNMVKKIIESIPKRLLKDIDAGVKDGETHKNGFSWDYQDYGTEFHLNIDKGGLIPKEYAALRFKAFNKKELLEWSMLEDDKLIGTLTLYLYKPELKKKVLRINYNFNLKVVDYKYIIKVTTDINTYIQLYDEILEYNGLKDMHRNNIGLRYTVDIKDIVGEERKINKL